MLELGTNNTISRDPSVRSDLSPIEDDYGFQKAAELVPSPPKKML